jgi:hypothetical protein
MSLLNIWSLSDLLALQLQLATDAQNTNQTVAACTNLDAATQTQWAAFYAQVQTFTAQQPVWLLALGSNQVLATGTRVDETQALQRQLYAWQQKLSAKCAFSAPIVAPGNPPGPDINSSLKYIAITASFLGTSYVVAKIASLLPSARERERRSVRRFKVARRI